MANKIGWCDLTLNPITGCTNFNTQHCGDYCYAARMAKRLAGRFGYSKDEPFRPTFHRDVLEKIAKIPGEGKRVFLNSMGDWFCEGTPLLWLDRILDVIDQVPQHHFLVLTKRPERIMEILHCRNLPPNMWLGVSVTCQADTWRIKALVDALPTEAHKFVSFEPLRGPIDYDFAWIEWAIIGAETGNQRDRVWMKREWLDDLCTQANFAYVPVFLKQGVCGPRRDGSYDRREEFPEAMQ